MPSPGHRALDDGGVTADCNRCAEQISRSGVGAVELEQLVSRRDIEDMRDVTSFDEPEYALMAPTMALLPLIPTESPNQ